MSNAANNQVLGFLTAMDIIARGQAPRVNTIDGSPLFLAPVSAHVTMRGTETTLSITTDGGANNVASLTSDGIAILQIFDNTGDETRVATPEASTTIREAFATLVAYCLGTYKVTGNHGPTVFMRA